MTVSTAFRSVGGLRRFRFSELTITRFVAMRAIKSACLWGTVFGFYVFASAIGFVKIAPTVAARMQILGSLTNNTGLKALFGEPYRVYSVGGFVDWRNLSIVALVAAIWGLLTATKMLRGEEDAGRWELLLAGKTTSRRATANALVGFTVAFMAMALATTLITTLVGRRSDVQFSLLQSSLFGLTAAMGGGVFLAVASLASQIMPTRAAANGFAVAILGVAFLLRAAADLTVSVHWLIYVTPFGWIELVRPLSGSPHVVWLVPLVACMIVGYLGALYLAGCRDLGDGLITDRDTALPHTLLLGGIFMATVRLTRGNVISWLVAIVLFAGFFGGLAKAAGQAFSSSNFVHTVGTNFVHQVQVTGAKIFIGFIFFLIMTLLMTFVASMVGKIRDEEAEGYLDNVLVRRTGRGVWLGGRIAFCATFLAVGGLCAAGAVWATSALQHTDLAIHTLVLAGVNATAPGVLLLGIGVCVFGVLPRLTSAILYGAIVWSFLLQLVGSILTLNHWLLDTSMFYHITLAPSVGPDWKAVSVYAFLAAVLAGVGVWRFRTRDLQLT